MILKEKQQSIIAVFYFFIAASLGLILRLFSSFELPITYKYFLHTHSHIALLGWVYTALTTIIYKLYLRSSSKKKYQYLFIFTQFSILGMLVSFPFKGYAFISIFFSTSFLIASYSFFLFFLKNTPKEKKQLISYLFIKAALGFMVLSSIGPWCLGIIMNTLGKSSIWYKISIYFYLHFQYNGWFILALFGFFFYILEKNNIYFKKEKTNLFLKFLIVSILLTFFLSVLWIQPRFYIYLFAFSGSILQIIIISKFIIYVKKEKILKKLKSVKTRFFYLLLKIAFLFFTLKIGLQLLGSFPLFSNLAYRYTDFAIGYIHLVFLGIITISIFAFFFSLNLLHISKTGFFLFLTGFIVSEIFIFFRAISFWQHILIPSYFPTLLTLGSLLMLLGILHILISNLLKSVTK